ncbi:MAG: 4-hydroxybenzoate octaprenyltransferase [Methylacidiphilales bacterium]|nr:4-hydroxybenzoate octaprenyltransferase [Candidatus Methylacidiphilales bacterium]
MNNRQINDIQSFLELIRFTNPVGWLLLVIPALWMLIIIGEGTPNLIVSIIFCIGAFTMRSAGCVINDIWDRNIDLHIERTKHRPLANKQATVGFAVAIFLCFLMASMIIAFSLPVQIWYIVPFALLGTMLYPLVKRVSNYPQLVLGVTFSLVVPCASLATQRYIDSSCIMLSIITILWVILYDTQYAIADLKEDCKVNVKSLAVLLRSVIVPAIVILDLLFILGWLLYGYFVLLLPGVYLVLLIITIVIFFFYQLLLVSTQYPVLAIKAFKSHVLLGISIAIILMLAMGK